MSRERTEQKADSTGRVEAQPSPGATWAGKGGGADVMGPAGVGPNSTESGKPLEFWGPRNGMMPKVSEKVNLCGAAGKRKNKLSCICFGTAQMQRFVFPA